MNIILFDNKVRNQLLPFTFTRSIAEIRVGILTIREKWELLLKQSISTLTQDYLQELYPLNLTNDNLFISASVIPNSQLVSKIINLNLGDALLANDNSLIALRTASLNDFLFPQIIHGEIVSFPYNQLKNNYDIFSLNEMEIKNDFYILTAGRVSQPLASSNHFKGNMENLFIEEGAIVDCVSINCENGVVYIGKKATIMENASLRGTVAVLEHAQVKMGTRVYGATTIGPHCRVGGEVSNIVMFGYSNKGHDGFLGNSVIGEWCNIGAGTNSSNLKNDYGEVEQWSYETHKFEPTRLQFCGLMMGDHSKCSIGTMFNTATVVGVAANLFGAGFHRKFIPSFSFGSPQKYLINQFDKIIKSESAMMKRRNVEMNETYLQVLRTLFQMEKIHN